MMIVLSSKNKLGFVNGSIKQPDDSMPDLLSSWVCGNSIVVSWLLKSVFKEISASIIFSDCATDIWNDLRDRYQQSNGPRVFQLRTDISSFTQNHDSVSTYSPVLRRYGKSWGITNHNVIVANSLVMVSKRFNTTSRMNMSCHFSWGLMNPFLIMAFNVKAPRPQKVVTNSSTTSSYRGFKKERPYCTECKINGHTIDKCYKINGYPPGYRHYYRSSSTNNSQAAVHQLSVTTQESASTTQVAPTFGSFFQTLNSDQCQHLMTLMSSQMVSSIPHSQQEPSSSTNPTGTCFSVMQNSLFFDPQLWIFDSGASHHVCVNLSMFHNLQSVTHSSIPLPDNSCVSVQFRGDIIIGPHLVLKDVLYVPNFKFNLFSISALTHDPSLSVVFFPDYFLVQDITHMTMIVKGKRLDSLYVLQSTDLMNESPTTYVNKVSLQS
ncbi:uncharacterized protein [Henckelia pumila]|uniref:uncharacterized protein n=1 Tax=Henckelia pumila TaxID=405737 RepID=UPI003C6E63EC